MRRWLARLYILTFSDGEPAHLSMIGHQNNRIATSGSATQVNCSSRQRRHEFGRHGGAGRMGSVTPKVSRPSIVSLHDAAGVQHSRLKMLFGLAERF